MKKLVLVAAAILAGIGCPRVTADSSNCRLVGNWPAVRAEAIALDPDREVIYVYTGELIQVLDISKPTRPGKLSDAIAVRRLGQMHCRDNRLYITSYESGFEAWDINTPSAPALLFRLDTLGSAHAVTVTDRYAFVTGGLEPDAWLKVFDVSDPKNPVERGRCTISGLAPLAIAVTGDYAYVAGDDGLRMIDISDPGAPEEVAAWLTPGGATDVVVAGSYAYVADGALRVIYVSNPRRPVGVGAYVPDHGDINRVCIVGSCVFAAAADGGLRVLDVSDPENPRAAGHYVTPGSAADVCARDRYAYVAAGPAGLQVVEFTGTGLDRPVTALPSDSSGMAHLVTVFDEGEIAEKVGQLAAGVASDGTGFFAVWTDERAASGIYGARVSADGAVLDRTGILMLPGYFSHEAPISARLIFDGHNYLVVGACAEEPHAGLRAVRVSPNGTVLDPGGILVADRAVSPTVGYDGSNYLVVWEDPAGDEHSESAIRAARISPDGVVLDRQGFLVAAGAHDPAVGSDGRNPLVVWNSRYDDETSIRAARISPDGVVLDADGILLAHGGCEGSPAVGFDGDNYLVVWAGNGIHAARVSPDGLVLDPDGIKLATGADWRTAPAVEFDGNNYLVVWENHRDHGSEIHGTRVSPDGVVPDPQGLTLVKDEERMDRHLRPALAFNGTHYLLVFSLGSSSGSYNVYAVRITPDAVKLDSRPIAICRPGLTRSHYD